MTGQTDPPNDQAPAHDPSADPPGPEPRPDPNVPPSGSELAAVTPQSQPQHQPQPQPPRPPRRTGVFVDPEDLRTHVGDLLRALLGGYEVDAFGNFTFTHEDARIFVTVGGSPVGPQVGVFCVTNLDIDLGLPLASFLLTTNHTLGFGSFSYDAQNRAVWLRHTLLGTTLDLTELQTALAAVATAAAAMDERIRDRFGGRTFQDAPGDAQRDIEPPEPSQETTARGASGYL